MNVLSTVNWSALLITGSIISGCAHMQSGNPDKSGGELRALDIGKAKVGLCNNPFTFEQATRYVGIDPQKSPEEREKTKREEWNKWLARIEQYKNEVKTEQKEFTVHHIATFAPDENRDGLVYFDDGGKTTYYSGSFKRIYNSAIPEKLLLNYSSFFIGLGLPAGLIDLTTERLSWSGYVFKQQKYDNKINNSRLNEAEYKYYGNTGKVSNDVYVMNSIYNQNHQFGAIKEFEALEGAYGGNDLAANNIMGSASNNIMYGINLDTKKWYGNTNSLIQKTPTGGFVFDLNRFNFVEKFGYYPDAQHIVVLITYKFTISHCVGTDLHGNVKEVAIYTPNGDEINRIKL